jgi:Zn-dependent membrane protease YugP
MFGIPILYILILAGTALLSFCASLYVKSAFKRGQNVPLQSGLSGRDIAAAILREENIDDVQIVEHQGFLSDHYNPLTKTLALSPDVYNGVSASSAGVAAHEVGHAIQHARAYFPMQIRSWLVPVASIGSQIGFYMLLIGVMLGVAQSVHAGDHGFLYWLAVTGIVLFSASTAFTVITVPVEFDASARAKRALEHIGIIRLQEERDAVRSVLWAAGLTYVAAAIGSIAMLLYWLYRAGFLGGGSRDD